VLPDRAGLSMRVFVNGRLTKLLGLVIAPSDELAIVQALSEG
jgi:hypothetical protein